MKVPFGPRVPNEQEKELLIKLGFNLEEMEKSRRYYYLNVPNSRRIRCEKRTPSIDRITYAIFYNDIKVISIHQKTAIHYSYVYFYIYGSTIEEALAENDDAIAQSTRPILTEYQKRLAARLKELGSIIYHRCYEKSIETQCWHLRKLKAENPSEHDALIETNQRYKELVNMFPDWIDSEGWDGRYKEMEEGPYIDLDASREKSITSKCSMM